MKPIAIKFNRRFKELEKELDDVLLEEVNRIVKKKAIEIGEAGYKEISKATNEIKDIIKNIKVDEVELFKSKHYELECYVKKERKYLFDGGLSRDTLQEIAPLTKSIVDKMYELSGYAHYMGYRDISNNIVLRIKETIFNKIAVFLNYSFNEEFKPYGELMDNELISMNELIDLKNEEIKSEERYVETKETLIKILDQRKMDKFLREKGFAAVRQKGSHKIYKNGTKTTVVPQHNLGKGLSFEIQKQVR